MLADKGPAPKINTSFGVASWTAGEEKILLLMLQGKKYDLSRLQTDRR